MSKKTPDPFTLVIFGASGDLTRRKLIPAVYGLFHDGLLPEDFSLIGYARTRKSNDDFRTEMHEACLHFVRSGTFDEGTWKTFVRHLHYQHGGYDTEGFRMLKRRLDEGAADGRMPRNTLFDLATPPAAFEGIVEALTEADLSRSDGAYWSRLIVEKPFGRDLESACELNRKVRRAFPEEQIFRIDHYLGKETVQNILVLRFANSIFEPIWNQKYIDHVQITVSETLGVQGRGAYYDEAGALRDILQNHMMHLLCLVAMEPPLALDAHRVRDEKVKLLRSLRPIERRCVPENVVRGQYEGYLREEGVRADSSTETYVALRTFVDNWRWAGVPFYLRTGKCLPARLTDISIHFKQVPRVLFNTGCEAPLGPNVLGVRIQPNEGISLRFHFKVPGPAMEIRPVQMDFDYASAFGKEPPDAYERLLLDAALGDATLFIRDDEVEAAWCFVDPLIAACAEADARRPVPYVPGSWGPKEADALIEVDGRGWEMMRGPAKGRKASGERDTAQRKEHSHG